MGARVRHTGAAALLAVVALCAPLLAPGPALAEETPTAEPTSPSAPADPSTTSPQPPAPETPSPPSDAPAPQPPSAPAVPAAPPPASPSSATGRPPAGAAPSAPAARATPSPSAPARATPGDGVVPPLDPLGPPPVSDAVGPDAGVSDALYDRYQDLARALTGLRNALALEKSSSARLASTGLAVAETTITAAEADKAAEKARNVLTAFTREAYMQGSSLGVVAGLAAVDADDIISALSSASYLDRVARFRIDTALRAVAEAKRTAALRDAAVTARLQAEAAAATARNRTAAARAAVAAAQAAYNAAMAAGIPPNITFGPDGCPTTSLPNVLREGAETIGLAQLCQRSVAQAPSAWAAAAIKWAFAHLGAPYACGGVGRDLPFRFDCSSLLARAYHEGAGLPTAGAGWSPSTRDMVPWDGASLAPNYFPVAREYVRPGDLALYDTGGTVYRHVVMVLADGFMLHTNRCGDVAHVERFWGMGDGRFLGARRVLPAR